MGDLLSASAAGPSGCRCQQLCKARANCPEKIVYSNINELWGYAYCISMTALLNKPKNQQILLLIGNSFPAMLPAWHGHLAWQQFLAGA
jgi:hypothetical protein